MSARRHGPFAKPIGLFTWHRDTAGYSIEDGVIVPKGGRRELLEPEKDAPEMHRAFLALNSFEDVEVQFDEDGEPIPVGGGISAVQKFVNEYGLLRNDGPQTVAGFWAEQGKMRLYAAFGQDEYHPVDSVRERLRQQQKTNPEFREMTAQGLADFYNRLAPQDVELRLHVVSGDLVVRIAPTSLITWMWLQLAEEKTLDPRYCKQCNGKFISKSGKREFCSDSCRYTYFNERRPKKASKGASK